MQSQSRVEGVSGLLPPTGASHPAATTSFLTLHLSLMDDGLAAHLTDGRWLRVSATGPWPPTDGLALPGPVARAIAESGCQTVNLQLCITLDTWPWEEELALAAGRAVVAPRFLLDLEPADKPSIGPPPLVVRLSESGMHRATVQQAKDLGRPLILTDPSLSEPLRIALERRLGRLWRGSVLMSTALAKALPHLGLGPKGWRLYGDGTMPAEVSDQGHRPVTALSIDVVKSTQMLRTSGNVAYSQCLQAYHERCAEVIHRLEGSMDTPQGNDGVMAYFGFPLAVEDAASRALMAAWQLSPGLEEMGLQVRIGVASARVAVSGGQAFDEVLHLAARLQQAASPGEVLVARNTFSKVSSGFRLERCGSLPALKDFADAEGVHRLCGFEPGMPRETVGPFVGRDAELGILRDAWDRALRRHAQWCTVVGEAGIGKSRLLQQFSQELQAAGHPCIRLTAQLQSAYSPLAAVVDGLRRHWHLHSAQDRAALQRQLAALDPPPCDQPDGLAELARLLAMAPTEPTAAAADALRRSAELLQHALESLLREVPTCLLVDDAHWLDSSSRELLQRVHRSLSHQPLLILVGERPGEAPQEGQPERQELELRGLTAAESESLALQLGADLPKPIQRRIVDCSGGIPLYLQESLRMFRSRKTGAEGDVPSNLDDLLMVWLDELGPDKPLAQVLSMLGSEASAEHVNALLSTHDPFVDSALRHGSLHSLLNNGLLQRVDGPAGGYRFKHALICDEAYKSIWSTDRRRLHGLCAELIERCSPQVWQQRPEWMAHHLQEAGRLPAARRAWLCAARLAAARHAHPETLDSARRALAIAPHDPPDAVWARDTMHLQLLIASAQVALEGYGSARAEAAYLAAEEAVQDSPDPAHALRVKLGLEACCVMRGDLPRALQLAQACVEATEWAQDPRLALQARWAQANVNFHRGDTLAALRGFDECLRHYHADWHRPSSVQDPAVMCLGYSSWIHFELGQADEALRRVDEALALATRLDHPFSIGVAHGFAASLKRLCGDTDGAWPHACEALRICEQGGFQVWLAHACMVHGQLSCDRGHLQAGLEEIDRGYAMWQGGGARISCATYQITRAELLLRIGRTEAALRSTEEANMISLAIGESHFSSEILRVRGLCEWQAGRPTAAEPLLVQALATASQQGKPGLELRCAVSLSALQAADGRAETAAPVLSEHLLRVPGHTNTRDAAWARTLLAAWSAGRQANSQEHTPWEPL